MINLPSVLRARDFRLYLENGKRLTDLWQYGGRAVLGHKPPKMLRDMKNAAERGLFVPFPHPQEKRFVKALEKIFPRHVIRVYASAERAGQILNELGLKPVCWRPFCTSEDPLAVPAAPVLAPVLPCPLGPAVLAFEHVPTETAVPVETIVPVETVVSGQSFPASDMIPPLLLAAATRAVYDLIAAAPVRGAGHFPKIKKALTGSPWRQEGIYVYPDSPPGEAAWEAVFSRFLEAGFLIPPTACDPLILPASLSPGEEVKLATLLME
jgi:hypothetical protein